MTFKKALKLTALCLGSLTLASNSFAQTEINRDSWSVSSNRNAADSFSAIDGNANTRWSTNERQNDGQFFLVDFNETYTINQIVLDTSNSSNDYPRGYELEVSTNGIDFTTIAAGEPSASGVTTINFSERTVGMFRITQTGSDNRFWWSIHELSAFESNSSSTDFSDSDDWSLSASTSNDIRSALDGNSSTRWATRESQREGQFYQINFNSDKTFDRILLDTSANALDYPREYEIQVSNNGRNFTTVASGTPNNNAQTLITFAQQTAQYVRIEQNGSDNRRWWSVHEMTISSGEIDNSNGNDLPSSVHQDIVRIADIAPEEILRNPAGEAWKDSYSVGDHCYCDTTFDHNISDLRVDTSIGNITVREACDILGDGPGSDGNPIYNDVQCGNGPANDASAGDEDYCPGRVDIGREGCPQIGPKWQFDSLPAQSNSIICSDELGLPECMQAMSDNGGGTIHLEARTYQLSDSLILNDNVDIIGQGSSTIIRFTNEVANSINEPLLLGLGVNNIELKDFTLHCSIDQDPGSNDIRNDHMGIYMDGPGDPSKGESTNNNNVRMERIEAYHCSNGMHLKGLTGFVGIDLDLHHNGNTERDLFHNIYLRRVADVHMSQTENNSGGYYASNRGHGLRLSHIDNAYFGNLGVYDNADHGVHMTDGVFNMRFYNLRNDNNCSDFAGACGEFRCYGGSENCDINDNAPKEETP